MRIAIVSPYALEAFGGVQNQVTGLATALCASNEVLVVAPAAGASRVGYATADVGRFVRLPANGSRAPIALSPSAWRASRRALAAFGPDVIHVHEPFVPLVGLAAATSSIAPVVATFHRADAGRLYRLMRPLLSGTYRGLAARVAVSEEAARALRDVFEDAVGATDVVANGVDVERFARAPKRTHDEAQVAFVGRHEARKGLSVLLEAFSDDLDAHLLVVGRGPQFESLRSRFARRDKIDFLGALGDEEVASVVASADVFVAPSLGGESFGVVLLEAMAAGTAVLASDLAGYRLAAGDAARFFTAGDPAALRSALHELLQSKVERDALVARGHARVAGHSFSSLAARYREIYAASTS